MISWSRGWMLAAPRLERLVNCRPRECGRRNEPRKLTYTSAVVNLRSRGLTLSYSPRQRHDPFDLLLLRQVRRIDQHGILGLHGLRGVSSVALHDAVRLLRDLLVRRTAPQLLYQPPARPLPGIRHEEHLQRRVRKHGGAHIAAIRDDIVLPRRFAHSVVHPRAHPRHAGDSRHVLRHLRAPKLVVRGLSVDERSE